MVNNKLLSFFAGMALSCTRSILSTVVRENSHECPFSGNIISRNENSDTKPDSSDYISSLFNLTLINPNTEMQKASIDQLINRSYEPAEPKFGHSNYI